MDIAYTADAMGCSEADNERAGRTAPLSREGRGVLKTQLCSAVATAVLLIAIPGEGVAASSPSGSSGLPAAAATPASYKGRTIDLARDWEGARACAVLSAKDIRCYQSEAEQWRDPELRRRRQSITSEADVFCSNRTDLSLTLYANTNYSGSSVSFFVAEVWHDLAAFGFDNVTSSWKNNTYCDATAATGTGGSGSTLTMAGRSQSADVGSTWNDVISSVRIAST